MPIYKLVEIDARGKSHAEEFKAPSDKVAVQRIRGETRGRRYELWRGETLIDEGEPRFRHRLP